MAWEKVLFEIPGGPVHTKKPTTVICPNSDVNQFLLWVNYDFVLVMAVCVGVLD